MILRSELLEIMKADLGLIEPTLDIDEKTVMNENKDVFLEDLLDDFLNTLEVTFPKPETTTLTNLSTAFEEYSTAVEKAIENWLSTELITSDSLGDVSNYIDTIKAVYLAYFKRKWQQDNSYMPELSEITLVDEKGVPHIDLATISREHAGSIARGVVKYLEKLRAVKLAANADLNNINNGEEPSSPPPSPSPDDTSSTEEPSSDETETEDPLADDTSLGI